MMTRQKMMFYVIWCQIELRDLTPYDSNGIKTQCVGNDNSNTCPVLINQPCRVNEELCEWTGSYEWTQSAMTTVHQ